MPTVRGQGPEWLRQRAIGKLQSNPGVAQASLDSMRRLKLEACLKGHSGCVNCLEWNSRGDLLASGSDDRNVIIWNPFKGQQRNVIKTGHEGNIFSVKFIPEFSDTLIATCASDCQVKLINVMAEQTIMNCKSCHMDRVKRLAVHPNEPHLLWSAGEDGYILQYDLREEHRCRPSKPKNLLIDLKTAGDSLSAKCLAVNPMRDEMIAVGANDVHVRLFDRRSVRPNSWDDSSIAYFTPGHLHKPYRKVSTQSYGTTYLAFSPDGAELLANIHAEQVYLFNTYEPWERYKSFEAMAKPLILSLPVPAAKLVKKSIKLKPHTHWQELKKLFKNVDLPEGHRDFFKEIDQKLKAKTGISKEEYDKMNELLAEMENCAELYYLRAGAIIQRGWRGDCYQAMRDSCCALALNPTDYAPLITLARAAYNLFDKETASGLLEISRTIPLDLCSPKEKGIAQTTQRILTELLGNMKHSCDMWKEIRMDFEVDVDDQIDPTDADSTGDTIEDEEIIAEQIVPPSAYIPRIPMSSFVSHSGSDSFVEDLNSILCAEYRNEYQRSLEAFDYTKRFCGHCNMNTDIKEVNFFGHDGEFIVGGSDDGAFYIWDKRTTNVVKAVHGDMQILNCLQPHPSICMLATSGIEPLVKLWSPSGKTCRDVESLELRCAQNQDYVTSDPLEAMLLMLYTNRDI